MIKLSNVSFGYTKEKNILQNVNLIFKDSGLYGIVAKSGFGKTTLLNVIGGMLKPTSGKVSYSKDISRDSIGYIFQDDNLLENLTILENIEVIVRVKKMKVEEDKIQSTLKKLSIEQYSNTKVRDLSGGERKRVSIALALLTECKVILADEPTSSLDMENSRRILEIFKELSKDILILFTCHNRDLTKEYSDVLLDLEHIDYLPMDSEQLYDLTSKKKTMSIKTVCFLHKKLFCGKLLQFIFSVLVMALNIALLAFSINVRNYDYKAFSKSYCLSTNTNVVIAIASKDNTVFEYSHASKLYPLELEIEEQESLIAGPIYFDDFSIQFARIDDALTKNEVILTDYHADYLEYCNFIHFYDYGELVGTKITINDIELLIKDVSITNYKANDWKYEGVFSSILSMSEELYLSFQQTEVPYGYILINPNGSILEEFITYSLDNSMDLYYPNSSIAHDVFDSLKIIRRLFMYVSILSVIVSMLWLFYLSYTKYKVMKSSFLILNLYGLKKENEYALNLLDSMLLFLLSSCLGILLSYVLSRIFDGMMVQKMLLSFELNSFGMRGISLSLCFTLVLIIFISFFGYFLSNKRKVRTHIEK